MSEGRPQTSTPGYRGALPPRSDWTARIWVLVVVAIFLAMFVLAALGFPSRLLPEPTPSPLPSALPASESPGPSEGAGTSGSPAPSAAESVGQTPSPAPTP